MYKFMKSLSGNDLAREIHKFETEHFVTRVEYSTCPYNTNTYHDAFHCVMIEYND